MRTTNTPTRPERDTGVAPRARGRHRKPRPRKALLAAGGLALAAGALSLVRLAHGPGSDGAGTVEAGPRPDAATTATDQAADTAATVVPAAPDAGPSSPTALGGLTPSPGARGPDAASRSRPQATGARETRRTAGAPPTATTAGTTPVHDMRNAPAPRTPGPAPASAPPSSRTAPTPAPKEPDEPKKPRDPGLCVPAIGLCVESPWRRG
ncbi:hypothetical protein [Streptomyces djakartensis]|uniref:Uncharacterized protein n=1 Tax=Streptomyces djakartensis TaxID=68193 RepID=A0ABQ2Z5N6_9ACTN|nr:hypothetical protein [Streptomyces djakartensis]GGY01950.1 hypothetical protein GCM10010384_02250 [Streptomyces djakartensis]